MGTPAQLASQARVVVVITKGHFILEEFGQSLSRTLSCSNELHYLLLGVVFVLITHDIPVTNQVKVDLVVGGDNCQGPLYANVQRLTDTAAELRHQRRKAARARATGLGFSGLERLENRINSPL